jgi:hypothetical protein
MIGFPAKSIRLWAAIGGLFFAACGGAWSMEQQFAEDNFAITLPDTWHELTNIAPQPTLLAAYSDATGNRRVVLEIIEKKPTGPLDDRFITGFEKGYQESGGGTPLSGKYIEVDGIKSYELLGSTVLRGKQISTVMRLIPGENQYYNIQALRFDGDASEDPEIQQAIGSFRFLHHFVPTYAPDLAFRIGQLTGYLMAGIAAVAFIVFFSRWSNRPPRPPPLPR